MILGRGDGRWSDRDRAIAVALVRYEASLCSGCQMDVSIWGTSGDYGLVEKICPACEALETKRPKEPRPGAKYLLTVGAPDGGDVDDEVDVPDFYAAR